MSKYKRVVVKLGTGVLTNGGQEISHPQVLKLVEQCAALHQAHEIIVCSSGAIVTGRAQLGLTNLDVSQDASMRRLFAAVGQTHLMEMWENLFWYYKIYVGQVLLTRANVEDRLHYLNIRDTFTALLEQKIVPIVNENDVVATNTSRVGDNDNLSALVAVLISAELLLILTDQKGIFTADPRVDPEAKFIPEVVRIDHEIKAKAGNSTSGLGVGGMITKIQAADIARHAGVDVIIASGREPNVITRAVSGESVGTYFPALDTRIESRKRWILTGVKSNCALIIDDGAAHALRHKGRSLLPAGLVAVEGKFSRGETVSILTKTHKRVAQGIVQYDSNDVRKLAGCHSEEIPDRLGYSYGPVIVHRDDLVLLSEE